MKDNKTGTVQVVTRYPNQMMLQVHRKATGPKNVIIIRSDNFFKAVRTLSHSALKVYMYLISNKDGFRKLMRREEMAQELNVSSRSISRAIAELEEKGYIRWDTKTNGHIYEEGETGEDL